MMDREEEICISVVGGMDALDEAWPRLALGHQQPGLDKARRLQLLHQTLREIQVELVFGDIAGAQRTVRLQGVSDIDDETEFRRLAFLRDGFCVRRFFGDGMRLRGYRRLD